MRSENSHRGLILALALLAAAGCSPRFASHDSGGDVSRAGGGDPTKAELERLRRESGDLQTKLENSRILLDAVSRSRDEYKLLAEIYRDDLEHVEKQFIRVESQIRKTESRADAITATAEARIILEQARKDGTIEEDSEYWEVANHKLADAEEQLKRGNYGGAVFFAQRSTRMLEQGQRHASIGVDTQKIWLTRTSAVNLREGPGKNSKVIKRLGSGEVLLLLQERSDWLRIRTSRDRIEGWVHRSLVEKMEK